jgi:hypothetical protein
MHHEVAAVVVGQWPGNQPPEELVPIGSGEDRIESVGFAFAMAAAGHSEKMQIVVAKYGDRVIA